MANRLRSQDENLTFEVNKLLTRVTTVSDSRILGKLNFVHADTTLSLIVNKLSQLFNQSLRLFV